MLSVITSINGTIKKTIPCTTKQAAYDIFKQIESKNVCFEKKFQRKNNKILKYEGIVVILDEMGVEINKKNVKSEEKFKVYGHNKRLDVNGILKTVFLPKTKYICNVTNYNNKVLIDDMNEMDIILCKNTYDAKRLMLYFQILFNKKRIYNFMFLGEISYYMWQRKKNEIFKKTGLTDKSLFRKTSR